MNSILILARSDLLKQTETLNCQVGIYGAVFQVFIGVLHPAGLSSARAKLMAPWRSTTGKVTISLLYYHEHMPELYKETCRPTWVQSGKVLKWWLRSVTS